MVGLMRDKLSPDKEELNAGSTTQQIDLPVLQEWGRQPRTNPRNAFGLSKGIRSSLWKEGGEDDFISGQQACLHKGWIWMGIASCLSYTVALTVCFAFIGLDGHNINRM